MSGKKVFMFWSVLKKQTTDHTTMKVPVEHSSLIDSSFTVKGSIPEHGSSKMILYEHVMLSPGHQSHSKEKCIPCGGAVGVNMASGVSPVLPFTMSSAQA